MWDMAPNLDLGLDETLQLIIILDEPGIHQIWEAFEVLSRLQPDIPWLTEAFWELYDLREAAQPPYMKEWKDWKRERRSRNEAGSEGRNRERVSMWLSHCMNTNVPSDIQGQTLNGCVKDLKGMFEWGRVSL